MATMTTPAQQTDGIPIPRIEKLSRPYQLSTGPWPVSTSRSSVQNRGHSTSNNAALFAGQTPPKPRIPPRVPRSKASQPGNIWASYGFPVGSEIPPTVPPIPCKYQRPVRPRASKDQRNGTQKTQDLVPVPKLRQSKFTGSLRDIQESQVQTVTAQDKDYRFSHILDIPSGHVHRRQLSECLRNILDSSFEVQQLPAHTIDTDLKIQLDQEIIGREHSPATETGLVGSNPLIPHKSANRHHKSQQSQIYYVSRCQCPPGTIICYCHSSEEFKRFYQCHRERKANSSISSTVCMLSVPRARLRTVDMAPGDTQSSDSKKSAKLRSVRSFDPGTSLSIAAQFGDWPLPSPNERQKPSQSSISTDTSSTSSTRSCDAKLTSFSRPFRPESGGSPRLYYESSFTSSGSGSSDYPVTPTSPFKHPSSVRHDPQIAQLDSMSTLSTFNLDSNDPFVAQSATPSKSPTNGMTRPGSDKLLHRSSSNPYRLQSRNRDYCHADDDRPHTAAYSASSEYGNYSSVQLATATAKSVVAMSRPLSRSSCESSQSWESYSSHQTAGTKRNPGSPVFQRPRLINVSS